MRGLLGASWPPEHIFSPWNGLFTLRVGVVSHEGGAEGTEVGHILRLGPVLRSLLLPLRLTGLEGLGCLLRAVLGGCRPVLGGPIWVCLSGPGDHGCTLGAL